jgi:class 3 adenylate cyclase
MAMKFVADTIKNCVPQAPVAGQAQDGPIRGREGHGDSMRLEVPELTPMPKRDARIAIGERALSTVSPEVAGITEERKTPESIARAHALSHLAPQAGLPKRLGHGRRSGVHFGALESRRWPPGRVVAPYSPPQFSLALWLRFEEAMWRNANTERRLAAILAVDVAGYTKLMALDEAGTHARLKALRREQVDPAVKRHGGRVVKAMGDGVLVEFPSAVEAATSAIAIQRAMRKINAEVPEEWQIIFRMGLNVCDIIIDEGDIFGDGVNVAARLQSLCEPGGVCISQAFHDQIVDKSPFVFDDLGEQRLKNVARPVRAFQIRLDAVTDGH